MNNETHPPLEQLAAFGEAPAATEHAGLRRHLANCADCRQRLEQLDVMSRSLLMAPPISEAATLSDELLQAIDNDQLNDTQRSALHDNPAALKTALHYAVHAPAMQKHFDQPSVNPVSTNMQTPSLLQRLLDWRPPAWGAVPITAAAAFALALVVLPPAMSPSDSLQNKNELIVASYTDRPILQLQDPAADLPGLGFFYAGTTHEIPFDGVKISYSRTEGLSASWALVDNAKNYHLRLVRINTDDQQLVAQIDSEQPQARFPQLNPIPGRYHWLLTGQVADGSRFRASGGFVVNGS